MNPHFVLVAVFGSSRWFSLRCWPLQRLVAATASAVAAIASAASAGLQAFTATQQQQFGSCAVAVTLGVFTALLVGCCCGCGWGLAIGASSPRIAAQLLRLGCRLAEAASGQPISRGGLSGQPQARPVQLRRPTVLNDEQ